MNSFSSYLQGSPLGIRSYSVIPYINIKDNCKTTAFFFARYITIYIAVLLNLLHSFHVK